MIQEWFKKSLNSWRSRIWTLQILPQKTLRLLSRKPRSFVNLVLAEKGANSTNKIIDEGALYSSASKPSQLADQLIPSGTLSSFIPSKIHPSSSIAAKVREVDQNYSSESPFIAPAPIKTPARSNLPPSPTSKTRGHDSSRTGRIDSKESVNESYHGQLKPHEKNRRVSRPVSSNFESSESKGADRSKEDDSKLGQSRSNSAQQVAPSAKRVTGPPKVIVYQDPALISAQEPDSNKSKDRSKEINSMRIPRLDPRKLPALDPLVLRDVHIRNQSNSGTQISVEPKSYDNLSKSFTPPPPNSAYSLSQLPHHNPRLFGNQSFSTSRELWDGMRSVEKHMTGLTLSRTVSLFPWFEAPTDRLSIIF